MASKINPTSLSYEPVFCKLGEEPYDGITFTKRTSKIVEKVYDAACERADGEGHERIAMEFASLVELLG